MTRVSDLLGIQYPILQGGMLWLATAELAAAVSNAGGLGIISPMAGMARRGDAVKNLCEQIGKAKGLTSKPFGVNIPLDLHSCGLFIDLALTEKVEIVVTAAGNPGLYTDLLHAEGKKVIHVVSSVRQAQTAESCGVDAIIAAGWESGGHIGFNEVPLFSLIPQVVDAVSKPVIAAGGIVDARGVAAALSLGAQGVQMGTRFVAVEESIAHRNYIGAILEAKDTDTVITCRKLLPTRSLRTEFSKRLLELEEAGASAEEIREFLGYSRARTGQLEGDLLNGEAYSGVSAGLIKEIFPAALVIRRIVEEYPKILKKIGSAMGKEPINSSPARR
jgi:enoyl-[acyl-carrier protein] reductase II